MTTRRVIPVMLNPRSGLADAKPEKIARLFSQEGVEANITLLTRSSDVRAIARETAADSGGVIVAAGGDGTVNAVASAVAGTESAMGVLPVGTLNHFAMDMKIPLDLSDAVRAITRGHIRRVDVAEVNGHIFINNSSIGLYPSMVSERDRLQHFGLQKWISIMLATLNVFAKFRSLTVRLGASGEGEVTCQSPFVFVGNNEYFIEGASLGKRERMDAGELCGYTAPQLTRLGLLRLSYDAMRGRLTKVHRLESKCAKELSIACAKKEVEVSFDGEVMMLRSPLRYRIHSAALKVAVPDES